MKLELQIKFLKDNIIQNDIIIKNLLKDIDNCDQDFEKLIELKSKYTKLINQTRQDLEDLKILIEKNDDIKEYLNNDLYSMQLNFEKNINMWKKITISSHAKINIAKRSNLFEFSSKIKNRFIKNSNNKKQDSQNINKESVVYKSGVLTEDLFSTSRMLAGEVERSKQNLDNLVSSSAVVTEIGEEFKTMSSYISNSKTLLSKYGRREFTDKILTSLACIFFFGCVMYVVFKRL